MSKISGYMSFERHKKLLSFLFIGLLVIQLFLFKDVADLGRNVLNSTAEINKIKYDAQTTLIQDTIRAQQRLMLSTIRQGWVQYFQFHPDEQLLQKVDGKIIYGNLNGETLVFDPATMDTLKNVNKYYTVKEKATGKMLIQNARPLWDNEAVRKIINIVATPVKAFGPTGDVIIFDSYTGEMLEDNSEDCKDTPEVLGPDGKRYITLDYLHPNNQNPDATKNIVENEMMWRKDSDRGTNLTYFFSEPTNMGKDANNFEIYPLGQYNREFQEKIILPYESVGVDGQDMQITIVLGAHEQEIVEAYGLVSKDFTNLTNCITSTMNDVIVAPVISVLISLIVIFFALFSLRVSAHICRVQKPKKEE